MNSKDLWKLRKEIVLNSLYLSDYENSFDIPIEDCCNFFEGYFEELCYILQDEIGEEEYNNLNSDEFYKRVFALDNEDNLYNYYYGIEDNPF